MAEFDQRMLPALFEMAEDKVPNVRLVVGKCLYKCAQSGKLRIVRVFLAFDTDANELSSISRSQHTSWRVWSGG